MLLLKVADPSLAHFLSCNIFLLCLHLFLLNFVDFVIMCLTLFSSLPLIDFLDVFQCVLCVLICCAFLLPEH